jgi:hypothetical protein
MEQANTTFDEINSGDLLSPSMVTIRELIAWELDEYPHRSSRADLNEGQLDEAIKRAKQKLAERVCYEPRKVLLDEETAHVQHLFPTHIQRADLRDEYEGLEWTLGAIDLRYVLAFQRRLVFDPELSLLQVPKQEDWPALLSFLFGPARNTEYRITVHARDVKGSEFSIQSNNPDLQLRPRLGTHDRDFGPFSLYGGCPFFEVAEFRGRWFLRDGYHRAFHLLRAGVYHLPAIVIRARTIDEVGATQPWFFKEEQLFSSQPPHMMDFLDEDLVFCYQRQQLKKTIRISIEESLHAIDDIDEVQGDEL